MIDPLTAISLGVQTVSPNSEKLSMPISSPTATLSGVGTFADVLSSLGESATEKLNQAEQLSMDALRGDANPREVAEVVMGAEQSLQVAIAIRDKVVSAFLEISRMAI